MKTSWIYYLLNLLLLAALLGGCNGEEELVQPQSFPGPNFIDIENDGYVVALGAQEPKDGQTGTWKIFLGENGYFEDPMDPKSRFFGEPGETYLLGWEVRIGDLYHTETISVSFKPVNPVIITQPGDTIYNNVSLLLEAEAPKFGAQGQWEILAGDGGRIENEQSHEAIFIGKAHKTYTLQWSLSYGSKTDARQLEFTTDELIADAGEDQLDLKTSDDATKYYNLAALLPPAAVGQWTHLEGNPGTVFSSDDPNSLFRGVADSLYTLVWTVSLDAYQSSDTLSLRFRGKWGMWTDERDGQSYRFVEINGLEWMAENFNYYYMSEYGRSWYYGQSVRAYLEDGYPLETEEERKHFGRLYNWIAASEATPEGWRLPTKEDFDQLQNHFGGPSYAGSALVEGGKSGIDFTFGGSVAYGDELPDKRDIFSGLEADAYYWTDDYNEAISRSTCIYLGNSTSPTLVDGPLQIYYNGISVRYVRDAQ